MIEHGRGGTSFVYMDIGDLSIIEWHANHNGGVPPQLMSCGKRWLWKDTLCYHKCDRHKKTEDE